MNYFVNIYGIVILFTRSHLTVNVFPNIRILKCT